MLVNAGAIEHATWTRGERHMQPLRDDLNWFQTNSLDVMFLFTVLVLTLLTMTTAALVAVAKGLMLLLRRNSIWLHAKTV
jgi:hypothetical protein